MKKIFILINGIILLILIFSTFVSSIHSNLDRSKTNITITKSQIKWAVLIAASGGEGYWHHEILEKRDIRDIEEFFLKHET